MLKTILAPLALLCLGAPAWAQLQDSAAMEAARDLLEATDFDVQLETTAQLTSQTTFTTMLAEMETQHQTDFPPELEAELRHILSEHMDALLAAVRPTALEDAARIYARYFTAEEIRELQRMQTHPVMMKLQEIAPQFVAELGQIGIAESVQLEPQLQQKVAEAVAAWLKSKEGVVEEGPQT